MARTQPTLLDLAVALASGMAGAIVFMLVGIRPQTWQPEARRQIRRGLIGVIITLLAIAIPLVVIMGGIIRETAERQTIQQVLEAQIASQGGERMEVELG